ncbi:hypothetical protein GC722_07885 [Auraticoccus sp. F435]|uniref:DUF4190 domain-containing protein n=1 Tax=Auraticoccus cholistanensis TaxID=2656650 RepID=A0A6A9UTD4_9ACTN|nr:hypothetical protein [Auraticoccus cholistanensis]MVA75941.1 hypothetical protein [Auraticoccus cholistanensis]
MSEVRPDPGRTPAVVGLVTALTCFGVVGLVISLVALRRSRRAGHPGTLAVVGVVVGGLATLVWLVVGGSALVGTLLLSDATSDVCAILGPGSHELDGRQYVCE